MRNRLIVGLALLAALSLAVPVFSGASSGPGASSAAKKKCPKGKKGKKCRKKRKKQAQQGVPGGGGGGGGGTPKPTGPTTRATLNWAADGSGNGDLDLQIWAPDGTHASPSDVKAIAGAEVTSGDKTSPPGGEMFLDGFVPSSRQFTYGICASGTPINGSVGATLTYVTADGVTHVFQHEFTTPQEGVLVPTGGFTPVGNFC